MNHKQSGFYVNSQDISELMGWLSRKFHGHKAVGSEALILCLVVSELCVKIQLETSSPNGGVLQSIEELRAKAKFIANDIHGAWRNFSSPICR